MTYSNLTQLDIEHIATSLGKLSKSSNGYVSLCPAHNDKTPSLSLSLGEDGKLLIHCFAECRFEDIIKEIRNRNLFPSHYREHNPSFQNERVKDSKESPEQLGQETKSSSRPLPAVKKSMQERFKVIAPVPNDAPLFDDNTCSGMNKKFGCNPSSLYPYHNLDGDLVGYIVRWDGVLQKDGGTKKETRPYVYAEDERGRRSWVSMGLPESYPLYNLPEIVKRVNDPILIVEGEKAAQRTKDLLPDYVLSTTMFGAMSPRKTDWSPLKGRDIVICPDFDDAGKKYGDAVFLLCKEAGARSIQYLPIEKMAREWLGIPEIPKGYDIADAKEDGLEEVLKDSQNIEDLIVPYLTQFEIESQSLPKDRFRLDERGNVEYHWEKKDKYGEVVDSGWTFLCSYLMVTHLMRDGKSDEWSRILKMLDKDGVQKEFKMPMSMLAGDGNALKERLLSLGVMLNLGATQHLKSYISMSNPRARARAFDKTGWDDNCYILSEDKIYSRDSKDSRKKERLILNIQGHNPVFEQKGCLEEWQKTVGKYVLGNSRLQFGILAALAAPLLKLLEEDNFGVHYFGSSSIGKSITLHVANSVWGKKIHTWRTTDNAAESLARGSNDGLLILDELSQVGGDHADAMSYMLGNGQGKARANRKGEARAISEFRLIFLSSGEIGLETKLSESKNNKKLKAGQTVRFEETYQWICNLRKEYSAHSDIWALRRNWRDIKQSMLDQLNEGSYQFSILNRYDIDGAMVSLWASSDMIALKLIAKALLNHMGNHIPKSCYHVKGHGGLKKAVKETHQALPEYTYVFRSDVKGYYESIDLNILFSIIETYVDHPILLKLIVKACYRTETTGGIFYDFFEKGIPMGSPLSPLLGAIALIPLDQAMERTKGIFYARFMDDWILLTKSKTALRKVIKLTHKIIKSLKFRLHPTKTYIGKISHGFNFLAYYLDDQKILPSQETIRRFFERASALYEPSPNRKLKKYKRHQRDVSEYQVNEAASYRNFFQNNDQDSDKESSRQHGTLGEIAEVPQKMGVLVKMWFIGNLRI